MSEDTKRPENPQAFPSTWDQRDRPEFNTEGGMTLRDYFAAKAIHGLVQTCWITVAGQQRYIVNDGHIHWPTMAADAYAMADAMLAERYKP